MRRFTPINSGCLRPLTGFHQQGLPKTVAGAAPLSASPCAILSAG